MTEQKLTKEQIKKVTKFQGLWAEFLGLLGKAFFGEDTTKATQAGDAVIDGIEDAIFETASANCRGTLNLHRLVMLFGHIAGDQLGRHMIANHLELDQGFPSSAADLFEGAYRVALEERLAGVVKRRPLLHKPDGGLLM